MDILFTSREAMLADKVLGVDGEQAIEVPKGLARDVSHSPSFVDEMVEVA